MTNTVQFFISADAHVDDPCHQQEHAQLCHHIQEHQQRHHQSIFFGLPDQERQFFHHLVLTSFIGETLLSESWRGGAGISRAPAPVACLRKLGCFGRCAAWLLSFLQIGEHPRQEIAQGSLFLGRKILHLQGMDRAEDAVHIIQFCPASLQPETLFGPLAQFDIDLMEISAITLLEPCIFVRICIRFAFRVAWLTKKEADTEDIIQLFANLNMRHQGEAINGEECAFMASQRPLPTSTN